MTSHYPLLPCIEQFGTLIIRLTYYQMKRLYKEGKGEGEAFHPGIGFASYLGKYVSDRFASVTLDRSFFFG